MARARNFYPVVLAGGRGTRFWPLSRRHKAKQLLALDGKQTMIQQTVSRLLPLTRVGNFWVVTNDVSLKEIQRQIPRVTKRQLIAEPVGRNTAPAIGLAAFILMNSDPDAVLGLFPSDHVVGKQEAFRDALNAGIEIAASGDKIVVLGVPPSRPETGYGYIEVTRSSADKAMQVCRFTEKPDAERAAKFLSAGNFYWNSGMFLWSARTLTRALEEHLPKTAAVLQKIAATFGSAKFEPTLRRLYPKCENISIDYAVLEPRSAKGAAESGIFCLEADFDWNDLGSWTALHEHQGNKQNPENGNLFSSEGIFTLNAHGNYVHAPGKFVAVVGVNDLVVVETADALLITTMQRAQDVGKVVRYLDDKKMHKLT